MKNKIMLLLIAAIVWMGVLGCDGDAPPPPKPSKAADLTAITVAGAETGFTVEAEVGNPILPDEYEDWLDGDSLAPEQTGTLTLTQLGITKPYENKVTVTVSPKAKALLTDSVPANSKPDPLDDEFANASGADISLVDGQFLYVEVTAQDGKTKQYYRFQITLNDPTVDAAIPVIASLTSQNATYYPGKSQAADVVPLTVSVTCADEAAEGEEGGVLSYQWYYATTASAVGTVATGEGATTKTYTPKIGTATGDEIDITTALSVDSDGVAIPRVSYFYVVVKNTNETVTGVKERIVTSTTRVTITMAAWDAETPTAPVLVAQTYDGNDTNPVATPLNGTTTVSDDGIVTYQWYSQMAAGATSGTVIENATNATFAPATDKASKLYYYVVVTNTNNNATGVKVTTAKSNIVLYNVILLFVPGDDYIVDFGEQNTKLDFDGGGTPGSTMNRYKGTIDSKLKLNLPNGFNIADYHKITVSYNFWREDGTTAIATSTSNYVDSYFFAPWTDEEWGGPWSAAGTGVNDAVTGVPTDGSMLKRLGARTGTSDANSATNNNGFTFDITALDFVKSGVKTNPEGLQVNKFAGNSVGYIEVLALKFHNDGYVAKPLTAIVLDKPSLALVINEESAALVVTPTPADTTDGYSVEWESDTPTVASVTNGVVKGLTVGTAKITATATILGTSTTFTADCNVTVSSTDLTGLELDEDTLTVRTGKTVVLTATPVPAATTDTYTIAWVSDTPANATVTVDPANDHKATVTGVLAGTAKITATATKTGTTDTFTADCNVTVEDPPPHLSAVTITTDGTDFIATGTGGILTFEETGTLAEVIAAIKEAALAEDIAIQFGDNTTVLDIGTGTATFNGTDEWGPITLKGKITSANATATEGTVTLGGNVSVDIVDATITCPGGAVATNRALYVGTSGAVNITDSTITGGDGFAIYHNGSGEIVISGGEIKSANASTTTSGASGGAGVIVTAVNTASVKITGDALVENTNATGYLIFFCGPNSVVEGKPAKLTLGNCTLKTAGGARLITALYNITIVFIEDGPVILAANPYMYASNGGSGADWKGRIVVDPTCTLSNYNKNTEASTQNKYIFNLGAALAGTNATDGRVVVEGGAKAGVYPDKLEIRVGSSGGMSTNPVQTYTTTGNDLVLPLVTAP